MKFLTKKVIPTRVKSISCGLPCHTSLCFLQNKSGRKWVFVRLDVAFNTPAIAWGVLWGGGPRRVHNASTQPRCNTRVYSIRATYTHICSIRSYLHMQILLRAAVQLVLSISPWLLHRDIGWNSDVRFPHPQAERNVRYLLNTHSQVWRQRFHISLGTKSYLKEGIWEKCTLYIHTDGGDSGADFRKVLKEGVSWDDGWMASGYT